VIYPRRAHRYRHPQLRIQAMYRDIKVENTCEGRKYNGLSEWGDLL